MARQESNRHAVSNREGVAQELKDWGLVSFSDATQLLKGVSLGDSLATFLTEGWRSETRSCASPSHSLQELRSLAQLFPLEAAEVVLAIGTNTARRFLTARLDHYQTLVRRSTFDPEGQGHTLESYYELDDETLLSPRTVAAGLKRDVLYASIIDTPHLAAYKLALQLAEKRGTSPDLLGSLRGKNSDIPLYGDHLGPYEAILPLYDKIERQERHASSLPETIEHRTVMRVADILVKALKYTTSPHIIDRPGILAEAIAWAQLGDEVAGRLHGMRNKIPTLDLSRIDRFIGVSGNNRYGERLSETRSILHQFTYSQDSASAVAAWKERSYREIDRALSRSIRRFEAELEERLSSLEDPLEIKSVMEKTQIKIQSAEERDRERRENIAAMSVDDVIIQLKCEESSLSQLYEKNKSLAAKAIDLHFLLNRDHGPLAHRIDWINSVPFGDIKRAHRMYTTGMSEGGIYAMLDSEPLSSASSLLDSSHYSYTEYSYGTAAVNMCRFLARYKPEHYDEGRLKGEALDALNSLLEHPQESVVESALERVDACLDDERLAVAANVLSLTSFAVEEEDVRVREKGYQVMKALLLNSRYHDAKELSHALLLPKEDLHSLTGESVIELLSSGNYKTALSLIRSTPGLSARGEVAQAAFDCAVELFKEERDDLVFPILSAFHLPPTVLRSSVGEDELIRTIERRLSAWTPDVGGASRIVDLFTPTTSLTPLVIDKAIEHLRKGRFEQTEIVESWGNLDDEERQRVTIEATRELLSEIKSGRSISALKRLFTERGSVHVGGLEHDVREAISTLFSSRQVREAEELVLLFKISDREREELQRSAAQKVLDQGELRTALEILDGSMLSLSLNTEEAKSSLEKALSRGESELLGPLLKVAPLPTDERTTRAVLQGVEALLMKGAVKPAEELVRVGGVSSEELHTRALSAVTNLLTRSSAELTFAFRLLEENLVSAEEFQHQCQKVVERGMTERYPEEMVEKLQKIEEYGLSLQATPSLISALHVALPRLVRLGRVQSLIMLQARFAIGDEAVRSLPEIESEARRGITSLLQREQFNEAELLTHVIFGETPSISQRDEINKSIKGVVTEWIAAGRIEHLVKADEIFHFSPINEVADLSIKKGLARLISTGHLNELTTLTMHVTVKQSLLFESLREGISSHTRYGRDEQLRKLGEHQMVPDVLFMRGLGDGVSDLLSEGQVVKVKSLFERLTLSTSEQRECLKEAAVRLLSEGKGYRFPELVEGWPSHFDLLRSSSEIVEVGTVAALRFLEKSEGKSALDLLTSIDLDMERIKSSPRFSHSVSSALAPLLTQEGAPRVLELGKALALPDEELIALVGDAISEQLGRALATSGWSSTYRDLSSALRILRKRLYDDDLGRDQSGEHIVRLIRHGHGDRVSSFTKQLEIEEEIPLPPCVSSLMEAFNLKTISDLVLFAADENTEELRRIHPSFNGNDLFRWVTDHPQESVKLSSANLRNAKKIGILPLEAEMILRAGVDLDHQKDFEEIYEALKMNCPEWQDRSNVNRPFEAGAALFGYKTMLQYGDRPSLSRHDAYFAWDSIIKLYHFSGLTPTQFNQQILQQVRRDNSLDDAGLNAHQRLNQLAQTLSLDISVVHRAAERFSSLSELHKFAQAFPNPSSIFASWGTLTRFSDLQNLLQKGRSLEKLNELRSTGGDEALCRYVGRLLFHRTSKVDVSAAIEFMEHPDRFLARDDSHAPRDLHRLKKPSNYTELPHLDLSARELVRALADGTIDRIQSFTPFQLRYMVPRDGRIASAEPISEESIRSLLSRAVGTGGKGEARKAGKVFGIVENLLHSAGIEKQEGLSGTKRFLSGASCSHLPQHEQEELLQRIREVILDPSIGISSSQELIPLVVSIHPKSSPEAVLAGDDTACCMPFGSGKNVVYTFNPMCGLMTIQLERSDGSLRTIAQSVLTEDKDMEVPVPTLLNALEGNGSFTAILPAETTKVARTYLCADNVEVAPSYKTEEWARILHLVYQDFLSEYLKRYGETQGLMPHVVPIGLGYSDALTDRLPKMPNTFVPVTPMTYSDKVGAEVCILEVHEVQGLKREVISAGEAANACETVNIRGVRPLDRKSSLLTAYVERMAYDNDSLLVHLHQLENTLIATEINNKAKGRPSLSLHYVDPKDNFSGYLLAYEGRWNGGDALAQGEPVVYVFDLAANPSSRLAGGKLMHGLLELYERHYSERGNLIPLFAEFREKTSYQLVKRHLVDLGAKRGLELELVEDETLTYESGSEVMHPLLIRVKKRE